MATGGMCALALQYIFDLCLICISIYESIHYNMDKIIIVVGAVIAYTLATIPNLSGLSQRDYDHAIKVIDTGTHTHDVRHGGRFKPLPITSNSS